MPANPNIRFSHIALWLLLAIGLYGALSVSYTTITGTSPCPDFNGLPICFLVAAGYCAMAASQIGLSKKNRDKLFIFGWIIVFLIAAAGTLLQMIKGDSCPLSDTGFPLCYLSLAISVLILVFYKVLNKRSDK